MINVYFETGNRKAADKSIKIHFLGFVSMFVVVVVVVVVVVFVSNQ